MSRLNFKIEATSPGSSARAGRFRTLHNEVMTPLFMPVGTQASVKAQTQDFLGNSGSQILLANTYHLLLRPGPEIFKRFGGIHRFMNWNRSVLTDSGGFQIFSLPESRQMTEEGARFQSYVDGSWIHLTPEMSIATQRAIGSDIMMVLDQCVPSTCDAQTARHAMELTHRWAKRSLDARGESAQSLFGIVQGACYPELRQESAETLRELPFDGFAIGGLAVGEGKAEREDTTELTARLLPVDRPRYLMGVGTPLDVLEAVHRGMDMFDCIIPTSFAQRGTVFTSGGKVQLRRIKYRDSEEAVDPKCDCPTCASYSKAYLHHLIKVEEVFGWQLLGQHNIWFYHRMMAEIRRAILEGRFLELYRDLRDRLDRSDGEIDATVKRGKYSVKNTSLGSSAGFASIRDEASGEVMHSVSEPMREARALYVEQSRLAARIQERESKELVIWDVGLGAATNAMAAVHCWESLERKRELRIVSFENDLDSLKLALASDRFEYLHHPGPEALLSKGAWRQGDLSWDLVEGDFLSRVSIGEIPPPDLIFYDPFSFKTNPALWNEGCFRKLYGVIREADCELYTYSASTAVRRALLAAGFWVRAGVNTGPKQETTVAMTSKAAERNRRDRGATFLNEAWLQRWKRSRAQFPESLSLDARDSFARVIEQHPQFRVR